MIHGSYDISYGSAHNVLLLHLNGADKGLTFTDSSPLANTINAGGEVETSTDQTCFGISVGGFTGSLCSLGAANDAGFTVGTRDCAIDFWMYYTGTTNTYPIIFGSRYGWHTYASAIAFDHGFNPDKFNMILYPYSTNSNFLAGTSSPAYNTWHHCMVSRSGSTWKLFVNGVCEDTKTYAGIHGYGSGMDLQIAGGNWDGSIGYFAGFLDEIRFRKNRKGWDRNFTPPNREY